MIVEDPADPGGYDHDWTVVLDDWIDGTGITPDEVLAGLRQGAGGMGSWLRAVSVDPLAEAVLR